MQRLRAVIMAAGHGKRMKSDTSKVLHKVCGKTMIDRCIEAAECCGAEKTVIVVGHKAEEVMAHVKSRAEYAFQHELLGTAHAVMQTESLFENYSGDVLILSGDVPAIPAQTLKECYEPHKNSSAAATILAARVDDPFGYGRVIEENGEFKAIVEQKDASDTELAVNLINSGIYFFDSKLLFEAIKKINNNNAQGEYYLPDVLSVLKAEGKTVSVALMKDYTELLGVNDRFQLAEMDKLINARNVRRIMESGVTVTDPQNTYIGDDVEVGCDTVIEPGCFIFGKTEIGKSCVIGPQSRLTDMKVGCEVNIANSVCVESEIQSGTNVGPFAYIRPNSKIGKNVKIGDFVEIKNSSIDDGTKVSHLTYVGDSDVGSKVNFGCGTVTVNYDGNHKYRTKIGDNAFIGCNTNLVAPVEVADNAFTAAGSTITDNVPADSLAIARAKQVNKHGWVTDRKEKNK